MGNNYLNKRGNMNENMRVSRQNNENMGSSGSTPACDERLRAIAEASFFAMDLKLYLDTHPDDTRAVEMFREAVKQYKACKAAFEDSFYPLTAMSAGKDGDWDWLCGTFPPLS